MKFLCLLLLTCLAGFPASTCSTFLLNDHGHYYFGRNYDWITGNGLLLTNPRQVKKTLARVGSDFSWTSSYGSITFNQYGKEFPTGGMNEKGLVVELMWLEGTVYPEPDARPEFGVLQWIQYQLDNCATIDEVIASDKKIRIGRSGNTPLHYLVADASGNAATIEFLEGKMVVHRGTDLPYAVLTNTAYAESIQKAAAANNTGRPAGFRDNSLDRFNKACSMLSQFSKEAKTSGLDHSFSILNQVSQGDYTKWSIVYDINARQIHFTTNQQKSRKLISFDNLDLSCQAGSLALDLNTTLVGDISGRLVKMTADKNRALIEESVKQSNSILNISDEEVEETAAWYRESVCEAIRK